MAETILDPDRPIVDPHHHLWHTRGPLPAYLLDDLWTDTGSGHNVEKTVFVECNATDKVFQTTMVTERYKLVVYRDSDEGELYDMTEDPEQYVNLWNQTECAQLKTALLLRFAQGRMELTGRQNPRLSFA